MRGGCLTPAREARAAGLIRWIRVIRVKNRKAARTAVRAACTGARP